MIIVQIFPDRRGKKDHRPERRIRLLTSAAAEDVSRAAIDFFIELSEHDFRGHVIELREHCEHIE